MRSSNEKLLSAYLALGSVTVTLAVVINSVTDPVNAPKLFILGAFGFGGIFLALGNNFRVRFRETPAVYITTALFVSLAILTMFTSSSPMSQNFYGVYGRNNGVLTYLLLAFVLISSSQLRLERSFFHIIIAFLIAGYFNLFYSSWAIFFGDFIPWNNPYGNILGTFGNPNFIGSFFGMFTGVLLSQVFNSKISKSIRIAFLISFPLLFFVTFKSHAIQGRVVATASFFVVMFFVIRERCSKKILILYSLFSFSIGVLSLLGALQKGPLTSLIYKPSVSLRGQYWAAGLNTGFSHPWSGVGFDAFGDWYRRSREARALVFPGPNTVVNASHNVPIDIFAFGGFLLLLAYVTLLAFALYSSINFIRRHHKFDSTFVTLFVIWIGYQLQSIISINQIGLAVWGWITTGSLIGYSIAAEKQNESSQSNSSKKGIKRRTTTYFSGGILGGLGLLVGALIAVPPLSADMKWRSAQLTGDVKQILSSLNPGYMNPQNTNRFLNIAIALESSNFNDEALLVVKKALDFNSDSFETWRLAYYLKISDESLKKKALFNMKRLDPLNPDVTSVPK